MSPVDPTRVREVFLAASHRSPESRVTFLRDACGDDEALRAEVESLLAHDGDSDAVFSEHDVREQRLLRESGVTARGLLRIDAGRELGPFTIRGVLGAGGMATVYRATRGDGREVALKILRAGTSSPDLLRRFEHEAAVLTRLRHPGIAEVLGSGVLPADDGDHPYVAMELVDGAPLGDYAARHGSTAREKIELVARVCDVVHYAHERGVVHRDLKPANILVQESGAPKVIDFGVARLTGTDTALTTLHTVVGQLMGTIQYMSPEQVSGRPDAVDARSDVYTLGVILHELLAGSLPYDLSNRPLPEAARIIQEEEPRRLGALDSSLGGDLEFVVRQAIAKEPSRRYPSAAELAADLRRYLDEETVLARRASAWDHLRRFARRHRVFTGAVAAGVVSLAVGLGAALWQMGEAIDAREDALRETHRTRIVAAATAIEAGDPDTARAQLEAVPEEARRFEWAYLAARLDQSEGVLEHSVLAVCVSGERVFTLDPQGRVRRTTGPSRASEVVAALDAPSLRHAAFSADGRAVAVFCGDGPCELMVFRAPSSASSSGEGEWERVARWSGLPAPSPSLQVDAAARRVAWPEKDAVCVAEVGGGVRRFEVSRACDAGSPLALGSDVVLVADVLGRVHRFDVRDPAPQATLAARNRGSRATSLALSADGRRFAVALANKRAYVVELGDPERETELVGHDQAVTAVAFLGAGSRVVTASRDMTIRIWDAAAGDCEAVLFGSTQTPVALACTADAGEDDGAGARIASRSEAGVVRRWRVGGADGPGVLRHASYVYDVAISPDGTRVLSASWDATLGIWDLATGESVHRTRLATKRVVTAAWSPSGERVLASGFDGPAFVIDAASGAVVGELDAGLGRTWSVGWVAGDRVWVAGNTEPGVGAVHVLDPSGGSVVGRIDGVKANVLAVARSRDAARLATGASTGEVTVWDVRTWRPLAAHGPGGGEVHDVAFSPDGARVAAASGDGAAWVWDVTSGSEPLLLRGHTGPVFSVVFTEDGSRVITGGDDTSIRVYDAARGEALLTLRGHDDYVYSLAFSPDGSTLVSGSGDRTVRLWRAER